jgi:hypothetical protein
MERVTFKILFYIKKTRVAKNGEVPVMLRVTVNGLRAETSVNLKVNPKFWNAIAGKSIGDTRKDDQSCEYLNRKLVDYPEGVENRTQAIQHRIETAGVTHKIGTNQIRALRIMLSGTHEDMKRIEAAGRLDEW